MTANAVQSATYSDLKVIKSRGQFQIVLEAPLEQMARFVEMFGAPCPGAEIPVAVARLAMPGAEPKPEKVSKPFASLPASQQAAMKSGDAVFQEWLAKRFPEAWQRLSHEEGWGDSKEIAAEMIRDYCGVKSRADIDSNRDAALGWAKLLRAYVNDREGIR